MPTKKILAAALLSMAAVAFANIEPMILGAIADDLSLGADKLGLLAGVELLSIGLASGGDSGNHDMHHRDRCQHVYPPL